MTAYEWLVLAYFSALSVVAWVRRLPPARRLGATSLGASVVVVLAASQLAVPALRAWVPHFYLIAGYWMPALLVPASPGRGFEEWLLRRDQAWRRSLPDVPSWFTPVAELAYLLCYPLVPLAFFIVWMNGVENDVERFWLAVLIAGYGCYVTLPWLVSRPPRFIDVDANVGAGALVSMNARVLASVSHQLNTFPSGHVAVAAAAAAGVAMVSLPAAVLLGAVVAAICVGAAAGRYHYVEDVLLGLALAGVAHLAAAAV